MDSDPNSDGGRCRGDLLELLEVHLIGLAAPAVPFGVRKGHQARGAEQPEGVSREAALRLGGDHFR